MNTCPVCGYDRMTHPPSDFYICPCCGTEFENDDFETSHAELRRRWLRRGARWFSRATPAPHLWNPYQQLRRAGFLEVELQTSDQASVSIVDFDRTQIEVDGGVTLYNRFVAIGAAGARLMERVHYATA